MIYILDDNVYITNKMKVRIGLSIATLCKAKEIKVFYLWMPLFAFDLIYLTVRWNKDLLSLSVFARLH